MQSNNFDCISLYIFRQKKKKLKPEGRKNEATVIKIVGREGNLKLRKIDP